MQDIIAESGLSAGAIYNYFSGKDKIIEAIAHDRHLAERTALDALDSADDTRIALKTLARYFVNELLTKEGRRMRKVGVLAWAEALLNPDIAKSMREGLHTPRKSIARLVRTAQENGEINAKLNADAVARAFIAMFYGFVLQKLWDQRTPHAEMLSVFDVVIDAIVSPDAKPLQGSKKASLRRR